MCSNPLQILEAVSRRVELSTSVDLNELADATEGYSGADLQALVYNAQLEIVHETIASSSLDTATDGLKTEDEQLIAYKVLDGPDGTGAIKSRAEEAAFQRRVRTFSPSCLHILTTAAVATYCFQHSGPWQHRRESRPYQSGTRGMFEFRHIWRRLTVAAQKREITMAHLRKVLTTTRPSVPSEERARLDLM